MGDRTWFLSGPGSPGQNCGWSPCRSPGAAAAAAEAPLGTGARRSWAEPWCGSEEAGCYSSHCGSHCPGRPRRCPGHPELQGDQEIRTKSQLKEHQLPLFKLKC